MVAGAQAPDAALRPVVITGAAPDQQRWLAPASIDIVDGEELRAGNLQINLSEPIEFIRLLQAECGVTWFNLTAGSPYYNPHIQRPAFYPPSDGYQPPEDPLGGCVRQIETVRDVKRAVPSVKFVGTAYSYLQEYLPHVAQQVIRSGWADSIGLGRLVLSDWEFASKVMNGVDVRADKKICRTFSDCTTAPRNGLISGCYPLDDTYKSLPEFQMLKEVKSKSQA